MKVGRDCGREYDHSQRKAPKRSGRETEVAAGIQTENLGDMGREEITEEMTCFRKRTRETTAGPLVATSLRTLLDALMTATVNTTIAEANI